MMVLDHLWLGLYVPIVIMSGLASWLLLVRLVVPAIRSGRFNLERLSLGLGALFAMASHTEENVVFGLGRWFFNYRHLLTDLHWAIIGKFMIVIGSVFTLAALSRAETTRGHIGRIALCALALWAAGALAAVFFADLARVRV